MHVGNCETMILDVFVKTLFEKCKYSGVAILPRFCEAKS